MEALQIASLLWYLRWYTRMILTGWKALAALFGTLLKFSMPNMPTIFAAMWVDTLGLLLIFFTPLHEKDGVALFYSRYNLENVIYPSLLKYSLNKHIWLFKLCCSRSRYCQVTSHQESISIHLNTCLLRKALTTVILHSEPLK